MYDAASTDEALRQGEMITNLVAHIVSVETLASPSKGLRVDMRRHPFSIVMTQDCDLDWDYRARRKIEEAAFKDKDERSKLEARQLPEILFCELHEASQLRVRKDMNSTIWSHIKVNKNERYHFFEAIPPEADQLNEGLPELAIDFKRYFTVSTDELNWQISSGGAQRRTRLVSPYLEHLSHRFSSFLSRVALPEDYKSMPGAG